MLQFSRPLLTFPCNNEFKDQQKVKMILPYRQNSEQTINTESCKVSLVAFFKDVLILIHGNYALYVPILLYVEMVYIIFLHY